MCGSLGVNPPALDVFCYQRSYSDKCADLLASYPDEAANQWLLFSPPVRRIWIWLTGRFGEIRPTGSTTYLQTSDCYSKYSVFEYSSGPHDIGDTFCSQFFGVANRMLFVPIAKTVEPAKRLASLFASVHRNNLRMFVEINVQFVGFSGCAQLVYLNRKCFRQFLIRHG